jgi:hypothetical protein
LIRLLLQRREHSSRPPDHRVVRDAIEAEEIAVTWLHWRGFRDARRIGAREAHGIRGTGIFADVTFDPLPMEREDLQARLARSGSDPAAFVSFAFAGWSPELLAWADRHLLPLVRFTFAGSVEPANGPARRLARQ